MPANLGPEYLAAEEEFRRAETPHERIAALERMYAALPKHKGTEKLQAELRRRLSAARKEVHGKKGAHQRPFYLVDPEGAGQVALVGPANAGKSSLVRALTHATPEVAPYPFTTQAPVPGMMQYLNTSVQLLDLPPLDPNFAPPWISEVLRHADACALVVDLNDPADLDEISYIEERFDHWRVARPPLLVGNKLDLPGAPDNFAALEDLYHDRYRCLAVSAATGEHLDWFRREAYQLLHVVRVYTKAPGKPADLSAPYTLPQGSSVLDAAARVHKDFAENLRFARLFRPDRPREGLMVDRQHILEDEDILEFHL